jgi:hypothetical protein
MEIQQREGADGYNQIDKAYLYHDNNSCLRENAGVLVRKVGWKPRIK